jgi:hypothetical protein
VDQPFNPGAGPKRLLQRIKKKIGLKRLALSPAENALGKYIDYKSHIDKSRPGGHKGNIYNPQLIRSCHYKLPIHQVTRPHVGIIDDGSQSLHAAGNALYARLFISRPYRTAGHHDILALPQINF